jgi:hypothetical protein
MKKLFIILLTVVALAIILVGYITGGDRSSSGPGKRRTNQNDLAKRTTSQGIKAPVSGSASELRSDGEPNSTQSAEQILTDISDANVNESTDDLKLAFKRLNKLCERAVRTRDAMLSVKFEDRKAPAVSEEKGPENVGD